MHTQLPSTKHKKDPKMQAAAYPWNDLRLAFFPPLTHFGIDLLSDFRLDFSGVSGEQSQEALCAAVDDVDLMEGHCVHHLLPLLQLSFRTLDKLSLQAEEMDSSYS